MRYIPIIFLYLITCYAAINHTSSPLIALIQFLFIILCYVTLRKDKINVAGSIITLMSFCIPISFRNIFGGGFSDNPLSWFYILCGIYVLFAFFIYKKFRTNKLGLLIIIQLLFSIIPLLVSTNKIEGFKEFITYFSFLLTIFVAISQKDTLEEREQKSIINAYIFGCVFSSIGILYQFSMFTFASVDTFGFQQYGDRTIFMFLFYDMSSATVYLATGAFLLIAIKYNMNLFLKYFFVTIIVIGMATSSSRAGLMALFVVLLFYFLFKKGFISKIIIIPGLGLLLYLSMIILNNVRGYANPLDYITYNNGRFATYIDGLNYFFTSPFLGVGFDLGYQMERVGLVIPHFAFIEMLAEGGIFYTLIFIAIILIIYRISLKKGLPELKWTILLSLIGSTIIPGFFSSRFFTVIAVLAILVKPRTEIENRAILAKSKSPLSGQ